MDPRTMESRDPRRGPPAPKDVPAQDAPGVQAELRPQADHGEHTYRGAGKLDGLVAIITGGDSGIGRAVAIAYAREGADVAIAYYGGAEDRDAEETARWVTQAGRRCVTERFDVQDPEACKRFVGRVHDALGRVDILVNNAAYQQEKKSILDITPEQLDSTFRTNIYGYFFMVQAALPRMKAGSVIINCGSVVALDGYPTLLDYSATKGAIHTFTRSLALNLAEQGIRVNCVAPGPVWTPFIPATMVPDSVEEFGAETHWHRPAQPAEIAPSFVFFASNDSRYYTGDVLAPTGMGTSR
jgi:NAD(P)-dependent dehydrogenase (short-subunit alcohol dehydrogenase family)